MGVTGTGDRTRPSMTLYQNSDYTHPYPAGEITLLLGSALYVGVSVEEADTEHFVVVLEGCYATHSPDQEDLMRYSLIQNR